MRFGKLISLLAILLLCGYTGVIMALSEGTPVSFVTNAGDMAFNKMTADKGIVIYRDNAVSKLRGRVIDTTGGTLTVEAENDVNDDAAGDGVDVVQLSSSSMLMGYYNTGDTSVKARVLTVSGTTITEQTAESVENTGSQPTNLRLAVTTDNTKALIAYIDAGVLRLCRLTISGNTVTAGTPASHTTADAILGMVGVDSVRVLLAFIEAPTTVKIQIINISSGITEGTPTTMTGITNDGTRFGFHNIARISDTKAVLTTLNLTPSPDEVIAVIVNTSGDTISSIGSQETFAASNTAEAGGIRIIDGSKGIIVYLVGSSRVETFAIAGSTITADANDIALTHEADDHDSQDVDVLTDTYAVYVTEDGSDGQGYASLISGVPSTASAKFYYAVDALTERSTLPFTVVNPDALDVRTRDFKAAIGGKMAGSGSEIVITKALADNYVADTDITGNHSVANMIEAVRWSSDN